MSILSIEWTTLRRHSKRLCPIHSAESNINSKSMIQFIINGPTEWPVNMTYTISDNRQAGSHRCTAVQHHIFIHIPLRYVGYGNGGNWMDRRLPLSCIDPLISIWILEWHKYMWPIMQRAFEVFYYIYVLENGIENDICIVRNQLMAFHIWIYMDVMYIVSVSIHSISIVVHIATWTNTDSFLLLWSEADEKVVLLHVIRWVCKEMALSYYIHRSFVFFSSSCVWSACQSWTFLLSQNDMSHHIVIYDSI